MINLVIIWIASILSATVAAFAGYIGFKEAHRSWIRGKLMQSVGFVMFGLFAALTVWAFIGGAMQGRYLGT